MAVGYLFFLGYNSLVWHTLFLVKVILLTIVYILQISRGLKPIGVVRTFVRVSVAVKSRVSITLEE